VHLEEHLEADEVPGVDLAIVEEGVDSVDSETVEVGVPREVAVHFVEEVEASVVHSFQYISCIHKKKEKSLLSTGLTINSGTKVTS
jgi:hypothetical protein